MQKIRNYEVSYHIRILKGFFYISKIDIFLVNYKCRVLLIYSYFYLDQNKELRENRGNFLLNLKYNMFKLIIYRCEHFHYICIDIGPKCRYCDVSRVNKNKRFLLINHILIFFCVFSTIGCAMENV